jgi:toxin ParE1/3/4
MNLRYTRLALQDIESLFAFIAKDDEVAAQKVGRAVRDNIDRLIQFPSYGRPGDVEGTRQFVVAGLPYIVVYETEDEMITVLRIYHAAQDRPGSR